VSSRSNEEAFVADAYRDDLAYIHDAGFGQFARAAAPVLLDALRRQRIARGLVIDLGCGSGILARAAAEAGYEALGIDISEAMIALARKRVPRGQFRVESILSARLPPCVAVAAIGECLNYLFDESNTSPKLTQLFARIYKALRPGGLFLFDAAGPGRVPGAGPHRSYWEGADWAVLVTSEEDRRHGFLTRRITSFRRTGLLYRRDQEVHRQRLLKRAELAGELRTIGFRVRILRSYGPLRFGPGHAGFMARRP
jgi:SAM-dependent methyltransferase